MFIPASVELSRSQVAFQEFLREFSRDLIAGTIVFALLILFCLYMLKRKKGEI